MRLPKRQLTGREKDEDAIQLLEKLRDQLFTGNLTVSRQTAFNLSWLQEDGLDILKEAIYANYSSRKSRGAAAYGLRKMRGRMRKPAKAVLDEGAKNSDRNIATVCKNALSVLDGTAKPYKKPMRSRQGGGRSRYEIRDLPPRGNRKPTFNQRPRPNFRRS
jgi:hypothetical protein